MSESPKEKPLSLQVWVDHYVQSAGSNTLRAMMLSQLRKNITAHCSRIGALTLKEEGISAYQRGQNAMEMNSTEGLSVSPLDRLVHAGELEAVKVFLLRLDTNVAQALQFADKAPEFKRAEMKAMLEAADRRAKEFNKRVAAVHGSSGSRSRNTQR